MATPPSGRSPAQPGPRPRLRNLANAALNADVTVDAAQQLIADLTEVTESLREIDDVVEKLNRISDRLDTMVTKAEVALAGIERLTAATIPVIEKLDSVTDGLDDLIAAAKPLLQRVNGVAAAIEDTLARPGRVATAIKSLPGRIIK